MLSSIPAWAAELELRYAAIERVIADQLFSQDGRLYVRGNKSTRCKFAYLESPHVGAVDGRLRVSARFSGRTALDMMGACVGLGDSFDFTLIAVAHRQKRRAGIQGRQRFHAARFLLHPPCSPGADDSFSRDFKIEVRDQARHFWSKPPRPASPNLSTSEELASFDLRDVRVQPDALVLVMDFRLVVK